MNRFGLTFAVPRGALFGDSVAALESLGVDCSEVRSNDRKLLFEDVGIVTMRPSDVPTYVEAGAADLGMVGKDVLMEHPEREVFELLDLGYGECRMVLASVAGDPDPAVEALRRLGVMRVATKYPRLAAGWFEETGRQAEIVEVKGSVELAPLTGMVEAIVDLTATGSTLRENGLVVREEIAVATARLIANPVAHKLRAEAIDEVVERLRGVERRALTDPAADAARVRALAPGRRVGHGGRRGDRGRRARRRRRRPAGLRRALRRGRRAAARSPPPSCTRALAALDPAVRAGLEVAIANVGTRRRGRDRGRSRRPAARGPHGAPARGAGAARRGLRAGRPAPRTRRAS